MFDGCVDRVSTGRHECERALALAEAVMSSLHEIELVLTLRNRVFGPEQFQEAAAKVT